MKASRFEKEIAVTVHLARKAAAAAETIRRKGIRSSRKPDGTPVTQADIVLQAVILAGIREHFPDDRVQAEETLPPGRGSGMAESAREVLRNLGLGRLCGDLEGLVNYRGNPKGRRIWMIDPIDGTKGYERGLAYAVAMGLYAEGSPRFGCLAAPAFRGEGCEAERTVIGYAGTGEGARWLEERDTTGRVLRVSDTADLTEFRMVGSRAHDLCDVCGILMKAAGMRRLIRMDGQVKYLMLASGRAEVYVRSADRGNGIAFPWDHCAGQIVLEEAGGRVTDWNGAPIDYESPGGGRITNLDGLLADNGKRHEEILDLLRGISDERGSPRPDRQDRTG